MKRAALHNLGCKVNAYETEAMQELLEQEGYEIVPFHEDADVYIINTCTVTNMADRKSRQMLHRAKKKNPDAVVVACGCYVQAKQDEIDESIDIVVGNNRKKNIVEILAEYEASKEKQTVQKEVIDINHTDEYEELHLTKTAEHTRAYIKVQDGCNQFCSYCIIPYTRGRIRSKNPEEVIEEVRNLAAQGYKEIMLLGQNVNSYGNDWNNGQDFAHLLRELDAMGIDRIRFMTSHPKDLSEEMILAMAECKHVCKQIHLPVQSGSNAILKAMNRKYTREHYLMLVNKLKAAMPDIGITTDLIAGFPGETEQDHRDTLALMAQVRFDAAFTFAYSPRKGTPAASMEDAIPQEVKQRRLSELIEQQKNDSQKIYQALVGTEQQVLVEGHSKKDIHQATGKIDRGRTVNFNQGTKPAMPGDFVKVRITQAKANTLFGERC